MEMIDLIMITIPLRGRGDKRLEKRQIAEWIYPVV
jgi:hypothetical protein